MSAPTIAETPTVPRTATTAPRTRWAAIIWGLLFAVIAATALWTLADADRRDAVTEALLALTPTTAVTVALLTVGVLFLVGGAAGLVRRAQRKLSATGPAALTEVPGIPAE
ncbi:hypothetical protein RN51_02755 [Microbacterium oxydans]|uniref:Uncharacterized protein n=1 Tax=Microbacterium oxydans TaxID=82380 RepID=A0A0F0KI04_9MICO|nr:hypothetical protein [Microbacterium oxydans]KJL20537.1 hypothetical protein RN51_02755 [Microbacterium oxydans]